MELVSEFGNAIVSSSVASATPTGLWDNQFGRDVELGQLQLAPPVNKNKIKPLTIGYNEFFDFAGALV